MKLLKKLLRFLLVDKLLYFIIIWLYEAISTVIVLLLFLLAIFFPKNIMLKERLLLRNKKVSSPVIWVHGASIGEVLSVKALLNDLKSKHPNYYFLITSHTKSAKKTVENNFSHLGMHHYIPFDNSFLIKKFLKRHQPSLVLWIEQDFLPLTLKTIKRHNIPLLLLNARMSDASFNNWKKFRFIVKFIIAYYDKIFAMSVTDKDKFIYLAKTSVNFLGNLKYTNLNKLNNEAFNNDEEYKDLRQKYLGKQILFALSTHYNEEDAIINVHKNLKEKIPNLVTFIMPRHKERSLGILNGTKYNKMALYSKIKEEKNIEHDVIIVDYFGKVGLFCKIADIAFVGRSLSKYKKGGQNLLEPLSFEVPVIFGYKINNFKSIAAECITNKAGIMVFNEVDLYNKLLFLLQNQEELLKMKNNTQFVFHNSKDILYKTSNEISNYL